MPDTGERKVSVRFAALALDEFDRHPCSRLQGRQQRRIGQRELHGHRRPFEAGDRSVADAHRCRLGVDFFDRSFGVVAGRLGRRRLRQAADRGLQIAFGVDQEVGGDDDALAVGDALDDFDVLVTARAEPDLARFKAAFAALDQHDLALAAIDHRRAWH